MPEPLLFEKSSPGRRGFSLPPMDVAEKSRDSILPREFLREHGPSLPEMSEPDVMRHYIRLSVMNHHVDKGFYPLGSCTMKYNPKVGEILSGLEGFSQIHPLQSEETVQGAMTLMEELAAYLCEISGLDAVTLQPAAGAHGEMTGIKIMRAYHESKGNPRKKIILPDSAHGTNPASATISGYETVQIRSGADGLVDLEELKRHLDEETAGFMLTNPNTLGLFESQVMEISGMVHDAGALFYMDGANLNALLGLARPGDMGFDIVHFNLHKTFSAPHGGGGPGSGPVGVVSRLAPFLPDPRLTRTEKGLRWEDGHDISVGKIHGFYGNFAVMIRAYVYIRMLGPEGLRQVSRDAIINANYLMRKLEKYFELPHQQHHMHEFVLSGNRQKSRGVRTLDIAKRLLDFNFHAPTIYFPLIVQEAMMIEPTECESKETLDAFAEKMFEIAEEVNENPECLKEAPVTTPVGRLDEGLAARKLNVKYLLS